MAGMSEDNLPTFVPVSIEPDGPDPSADVDRTGGVITIELGHDLVYWMQRSFVAPKDMDPQAVAYYTDMFEKLAQSEEWQTYMETESLSPLWMTPEEQQAYWETQIERHKELLAEMDE